MMVEGGCMFFLSFFLFGGLHGWCLLMLFVLVVFFFYFFVVGVGWLFFFYEWVGIHDRMGLCRLK